MTPTVRRASLARSPPDPPGRGRSRGSPSPPSSPNRRTRRAPRRPAQIQTVVPAGRKVDRERSAGAPGDCPGGLQTSLEKNVLFKGGLQPPPGRGPAAVLRAGGAPRGGVPTRPTRPRGSTTAGRDPESGDRSRLLDRLHQQSWLSWNAFIDRHGRPGRPDGARSRWRVSPTSELGPWRPCESVPGVLPAPPRASRPTPVSSRRPGCQEAAGAPPRASERPPLPGPRAAHEGDSCYDAQEIACLDSKGSAGGRQSSDLRGEAPTDDRSRPAASPEEVARWTDPLP